MFFLGVHITSAQWWEAAVPLCVSRRRMPKRKIPTACAPWILDSGGFSELSEFGEWRTSEDDYVREVERWRSVGQLVWVAPQDWMCEPVMVAKTGLTVREHHVGIVQVWPTNLYAPAGVYMAGCAFLFRDTVQRLASVRLALLGIACGALLSLLVSPTLAGASAAAFSVSEVTGLVVLALLGRRLMPAIIGAQVAAALVDSFVFLWLAFGSVEFWQGQTVGKLSVLALAFPVVYGSRRWSPA